MDRSLTFMSTGDSTDTAAAAAATAAATAGTTQETEVQRDGGDDGSVAAAVAEQHPSSSSSSLLPPDSDGQAATATAGGAAAAGKSGCCEVSDCQQSALWMEVANDKRRVCQHHREEGVAYSQLVPICAEKVHFLQSIALTHLYSSLVSFIIVYFVRCLPCAVLPLTPEKKKNKLLKLTVL